MAFYASHQNAKERATYGEPPDGSRSWLISLHARQDLKLIALLLGGVIVMLGIIADRIR